MGFKLNGRRDTKTTLTYEQLYTEEIAVEESNTNALSTKRDHDISGYKSRIMTPKFSPEFSASKVSVTESKFKILWIEFSFF